MKKIYRKIKRRKIWAGLLLLGILLAQFHLSAYGAPREGQETNPSETGEDREQIVLEKTARWTDAAKYRGEIQLKIAGIERYTKGQTPVQVVPVLDMTGSMNCCESQGHVFPLRAHAISEIPNYKELWAEVLKPGLPTQEEYTRMGQENPENLFLPLPKEIDPEGRARLFCCQRSGTDGYNQNVLGGWKVIYVTEDQTPLWELNSGEDTWFYHCVKKGDFYQPIGEMVALDHRTVWKMEEEKTESYGCTVSRMDALVQAYGRFIEAVFENEQAKVCPVAFLGGYYSGGWQEDPETALRFVSEKEYRDYELITPEVNAGTNLEAAVRGALDALSAAETLENTYVLLFTDGAASSGYFHGENGEIDPGRLDPHSYHQEQWDPDWYPTFGKWAVEDAADLKEQAPFYTVGYGYHMTYDDFSQETLRQMSSGEEYFIDTRREEFQDILQVFQTIYQDMIQKATQVQAEDVISEYWEVDAGELPYGWEREEIPITNQKGTKDTVTKITFPITAEMGADDGEEFSLPVTLREEYRQVEEQTWYPTNQDSPMDNGGEGMGARVTYRDFNGDLLQIQAPSPRLDVFPSGADFSVKKTPLQRELKAGETAKYEFLVENTGQTDLVNLLVEDRFAQEGMAVVFQEQEGIVLSEEGAMIRSLPRGASVTLYGEAKTDPEGEGELKNTVTVSAEDPGSPGEYLTREDQAQVTLLPGTLDFTVEKRADREAASPGEVVNYQILIENKGEQPLHSVVTTDRFLQEGVTAKFLEQEGVTIEAEGTQAVIPQILPGERWTLEAQAVIPEDFREEELVNVAVVSVPGQDKEVLQEGSAAIEILQEEEPEPVPKPLSEGSGKEPEPPAAAYEAPKEPTGTASPKGSSYSSYKGTVKGGSPKTGDTTQIYLWVFAAAASAGGILAAVFLKKGKTKRKGEKGNIEKAH